MTARHSLVDVVLVIDSPQSMSKVRRDATNKAFDFTRDVEADHPHADCRWGAVSYRDPVDRPGEDEHVVFDLKGDDRVEELAEFFDGIQPSGGGDIPEDFVGALRCVFETISWRRGSTRVVMWLAGSNAHGFKFSRRHRHDDQVKLLDEYVIRLAREGYRFAGISMVEDDGEDVDDMEKGANRTFAAMKELYDENNGRSFTFEMFAPVPGQEMNGLTATLTRSIRDSFVLG
jgi:hypothetical protein